MSLARRRNNGLVAVLVGSAALMMVGTAVAERPGRKVGPGAAERLADPSAKALKEHADEARELSVKIDSLLDTVEKSVRDLENTTDKIQDKGDKSALSAADSQLNMLKLTVKNLDERTSDLVTLATRMDREIDRLKTGGPANPPGPRRR